jgi:hypothetical protein
MRLAHKLSMELRSAEDRINQLEAELALFRDRAVRAERWLQTIYCQHPRDDDGAARLRSPRPFQARMWVRMWVENPNLFVTHREINKNSAPRLSEPGYFLKDVRAL